jgi:hypothetical protein
MDLVHVTNSPRTLVLGDSTYRCRTLTLGQIGEVLAWLRDRTAGDVLFSSEASRIALATTEGLAVLLHLSCEHHQPGMTRDEARALAGSMDADDEARLIAIAFRRAPSKPASDDDPPSKDLASINWGEMFEWMSGHKPEAYAAVAGLTLDQFDCFAHKGEAWDADQLDPREVQRMWEEAQAVDPDLEVATSG